MSVLAVLASGRGSNFEAICSAFAGSELYPRVLICDRAEAPVLEKARRSGVEAIHLPFPVSRREEAAAELDVLLQDRGVDLVALAGFMKVLPASFVRKWKGRILNIHPSLLPRYPGTDAIRRAWEAGEEVFGITIHLVDEGVDTGPVLFQNMTRRLPEDTLETMEEKVHRLEHWDYPRIIRQYALETRRQ